MPFVWARGLEYAPKTSELLRMTATQRAGPPLLLSDAAACLRRFPVFRARRAAA
jgi:hypothetical protein